MQIILTDTTNKIKCPFCGHHFAVKGTTGTSDSVRGFISTGTVFAINNDTNTPSAVTNLSGLPGSDIGNLKFTWTGPGDDGLSGDLVAGSSYTVQYTNSPTFTGWSPTGTPPGFAPIVNIATNNVSALSTRSYELTGVTIGSIY